MHETLIKRTIWVAECKCNEGKEEDNFRKVYTNPEDVPRETKCMICGAWIIPKEESYIGEDKFDSKQ